MRERNSIVLLCILFLVIGAVFYYFTEANATQFTFESSTITSSDIHDNKINESLAYEPSLKGYHTLYRNFGTPIMIQNDLSTDNIVILDVKCTDGTPYFKTYDGAFYSEYTKNMEFTESNEYGCGFGNDVGFKVDTQYSIQSRYSLNAKTLTEFHGRHYIRFVAYSRNAHPLLVNGKNLFISENFVSKKVYMASEDVIIYIPYEPVHIEDYRILAVNRLDFGNTNSRIFKILFLMIPVVACFLIWRKFGKEHIEGDYPEELSQYPKERKAWEVSAYFTPPFGVIDQNFNSTMLMDFYNRKIIDVKTENKASRIKILKDQAGLDNVEKEFYALLKKTKELSTSKDGYFDMSEIKDPSKTMELWKKQQSLQQKVSETAKEYHDNIGVKILFAVFIPLMLVMAMMFNYWIIYALVTLITLGVICGYSALFMRFNKEYYPEYQKWQGFKNYLSTLDSMKRSPPQGAIIWEKYLVYATALGVGRKVLDTFKKWKVINAKTYDHYNRIYAMPIIMMNPAGTGTPGMGGGGGFSGGGIGGGGGGGR